jgi:glycosyltransferase involved in cell wall biosynthesis
MSDVPVSISPGSPRFSILCTASRTEAFLPEAIESVLAQTYPNWELIVVDNGMSDAIAGVVDHYAKRDLRIQLVRQPNRGIGGGVSAAAAHASGADYIVMHSDDMLVPEYCQRMASVLDANPEIDAIGCNLLSFADRTGTRSFFIRSEAVRKPVPDRYLTLTEALDGVLPGYAGVYRRAAWERAGGYTTEAPGAEDLVLWLRLLTDGANVYTIGDRLCRYRVRRDSVSYDLRNSEVVEDQRERALIAAANASGRPEDFAALKRELRRGRHRRSRRRARSALLAGDLRAARKDAVEAYRQRRSARGAAVLVALTVAPGALRHLHPIKERLVDKAGRFAEAAIGLIRSAPHSTG